MSQPSRPQARGPAQRRRRDLKIEALLPLEERSLLAPVVTLFPRLAAYTPSANLPTGVNQGGVVVTLNQPDGGFLSAAPFASVTQLTPITSFGGDIVRIKAGPGGDFGKGVYAISRGAGANGLPADSPLLDDALPRTVTSAINRPGVIYRVDPATGKSSVFFDLNTVMNQLDPGTTPGNDVGVSTGLYNWYDISFDPEGYFDGRPSMFVASVDRTNPVKNAIYRIAPDGSFMGAFATFTDGSVQQKFNITPSAVEIPGPENQQFLRGLFSGAPQTTTGTSISTSSGGPFAAFFFDSNAYSPGQVITNGSILPTGVGETGMTLGPIVGLTTSNPDYVSRIYSAFTDFGTPAAGGIPANPGFSGVQGLNGELLINGGLFPANAVTTTDSTITDRYPVATTDFRRFTDIAFDQYGYFAQGANVIATGTGGTGGGGTGNSGSVGGTGAGGGSGSGVGQNLGAGIPGVVVVNPTITSVTLAPASAGNLFVGDLGTGLSVPITPSATATDGTTITPAPPTIRVPVQGPEFVSVTTNPDGSITTLVTPVGPGLGGRIVRILPDGTVRTFADNFNTLNVLDGQSLAYSDLSLDFSADGTIMYAADDDGIWQFKTTTSLASSTSGSIVGLNDLRSLGIPYEGQDSAVVVLDTGVDANSPGFRGRVARGTNVITNGYGDDDTAVFGSGTTTGGGGGTGGGGTGGNTGGNPAPSTTADGHGTLVAGVIAQFVPQASIVPVNLFAPFLAVSFSGTAGGGTGGGGTGGGTTTVTGNSNTLTSSQYVYKALEWVAKRPFVNDPVRPGQTNRVIAATLGFGTTETFDGEGTAYKKYPQIVISFKNQLRKFRHLGIAPIAAAGQFGAPLGAGTGTGGGGTGGGGTTTNNNGGAKNNAQNASVGDVSGMSLPAVLNEVISVTGSYPYPFATGPDALPTNPPVGVVPRPQGPLLVFNNALTIGGNATNGNTGGGTGGGGTTSAYNSLLVTLTNADFAQYSDRVLGSMNRSVTTDFAAPALDIPTFRRTFGTVTGTGTGTGTGNNFGSTNDPNDHMTFSQGGSSLSSAIVTGAYSLVSSALNYWATINRTGVTSDAYLTQPVGARTLNYGPHAFKDMTAYNTPDGINAILQWTAVPITDPNDGLSASAPFNAIGSTEFRNYSRVSVSNAVAAIEGEIALQWLIANNQLEVIDANKNNIISAQELQDFVDNAMTTGNAEAGAMARFLGGTARTPAPSLSGLTGRNAVNEQPDQPDILQRRFNFFDYAADGTLNGSVTIDQLQMLSHTLLPLPDAFVINDRQRASVNGYLLAPEVQRNWADLQHIKPTYQFVPKSALWKYRNMSPAKFHVARGVQPGFSFPIYTLYDGPSRTNVITNVNRGNSNSGNSGNTSTGSGSNGGSTSTTGTGSGSQVAVTTGSGSSTTTPTSSTGTPSTTNPLLASLGMLGQGSTSSITTSTGTAGQTTSVSGMSQVPTIVTPTATPQFTPTSSMASGNSAVDPLYAATLGQQTRPKSSLGALGQRLKNLLG
ncbi:MAG: hypothetical protein U0794_15015 [Isosphaeraceae bacterium]